MGIVTEINASSPRSATHNGVPFTGGKNPRGSPKGPGGARRPFGAASDGAVVATFTVIEADAEPLGVADVGLTVQVASDGAPAHAKLTAWLNPPSPLRLTE
jgi:hypothetical protein